MKTDVHAGIIFKHIHVPEFNRKIFRTHHEFRRTAKIPCCRKQMRILSTNPKRHKTTHRKAGDCPVFPVGNRAVMGVNMFNKFRKIKRKLPIRLYRAHVVRPYIIFFIRGPVITVGFHNDHIVGQNKVCNVIPLVLITFVKIRIIVTASKIPLGPAMIKIDYRIPFRRNIIIMRRQKNPEVSDFPQYGAVMPCVNNGHVLCTGTKGDRKQQKEANYGRGFVLRPLLNT